MSGLGEREPIAEAVVEEPKPMGLREWRMSQGMTQAQLAQKLGYSQSEVSKWETGLLPCSRARQVIRIVTKGAVSESTFGKPSAGPCMTVGRKPGSSAARMRVARSISGRIRRKQPARAAGEGPPPSLTMAASMAGSKAWKQLVAAGFSHSQVASLSSARLQLLKAAKDAERLSEALSTVVALELPGFDSLRELAHHAEKVRAKLVELLPSRGK